MQDSNEMRLEFDSRSCNEGFARVAVAAFLTQLNPTLEEVADVKTALSEAVTNCIVHGYAGAVEKILVHCRIEGNIIEIRVIDHGCGISDIEKALWSLCLPPKPEDRTGPEWASRLWRRLWIRWRFCPNPERAPR